ncbi:hypothetical protein EJB05_44049, partial [Eragrostis curvula]
MVTQGLPQWNRCADNVRRKLCKIQNSKCRAEQPAGYTRICQSGYDGNPLTSMAGRGSILCISIGSGLSSIYFWFSPQYTLPKGYNI